MITCPARPTGLNRWCLHPASVCILFFACLSAACLLVEAQNKPASSPSIVFEPTTGPSPSEHGFVAHGPGWYLGTEQSSGLGLLKSTDGGLTWESIGLAADTVSGVALAPGSTGALYAGVNGGRDEFVAVVSPFGDVLTASYVGGTGGDEGRAVAFDASGAVHVAGFTASADFPVEQQPPP
jgi:hypothetical protein